MLNELKHPKVESSSLKHSHFLEEKSHIPCPAQFAVHAMLRNSKKYQDEQHNQIENPGLQALSLTTTHSGQTCRIFGHSNVVSVPGTK